VRRTLVTPDIPPAPRNGGAGLPLACRSATLPSPERRCERRDATGQDRQESPMNFACEQEVQDFLSANSDIELFELFILDANGVPRG
ncbi:hypothetical protein, partial [Bacillus cereus group sp. Bce018]|uniref:hypothetical protein n=1 Tax=Bacillus cereus group sp. Bce018 TaxID=3445248 RepID=UPI003F695CE4